MTISSTYKIYCGFMLGNTTASLGACVSNQINNQFDTCNCFNDIIVAIKQV